MALLQLFAAAKVCPPAAGGGTAAKPVELHGLVVKLGQKSSQVLASLASNLTAALA